MRFVVLVEWKCLAC